MTSRPSLPKIEPRASFRLRRSSVIRPSASRRLGASKGANTCKSVSRCEPSSWSRWNFQWNSRPANLSPSRFSRPNLSHSRCQPSNEHPRLHLAHHRLPCLEMGKDGVEVALRGAVEAQPVAGGEMQGFCCRRTHRWAWGGGGWLPRASANQLHLRRVRVEKP